MKGHRNAGEPHIGYKKKPKPRKTPPSEVCSNNVLSDNSNKPVLISFMSSAKFVESKYCFVSIFGQK